MLPFLPSLHGIHSVVIASCGQCHLPTPSCCAQVASLGICLAYVANLSVALSFTPLMHSLGLGGTFTIYFCCEQEEEHGMCFGMGRPLLLCCPDSTSILLRSEQDSTISTPQDCPPADLLAPAATLIGLCFLAFAMVETKNLTLAQVGVWLLLKGTDKVPFPRMVRRGASMVIPGCAAQPNVHHCFTCPCRSQIEALLLLPRRPSLREVLSKANSVRAPAAHSPASGSGAASGSPSG